MRNLSPNTPSGGWTVNNFPYLTELSKCGRDGRGSTAICDPDGIISFEARNNVDEMIAFILRNTTSPCDNNNGYKVVFALMSTIGTQEGCGGWFSGNEKQCNAKNMAKGLYNKWRIGSGSCNDGVIFVLGTDPRYIYIYAGP